MKDNNAKKQVVTKTKNYCSSSYLFRLHANTYRHTHNILYILIIYIVLRTLAAIITIRLKTSF